jgi:hypothetical protein
MIVSISSAVMPSPQCDERVSGRVANGQVFRFGTGAAARAAPGERGREARPDFAGRQQPAARVVPDDERVNPIAVFGEPADHELLALLKFNLDPLAAPLAGFVFRVDALRHDAFQTETTNGVLDLRRGPR